MTQITATGTFPNANGFKPGKPFNLHVLGGTTITATIKYKTSEGNWVTIPDDSGLSDITGNYLRPIQAGPGDEFLIDVTAVSGSWDYGYSILAV